ncbi:cytochrome P450 [Egibacter rhizosphaerae]|uniref:Cytochrome P450 n=1 Tax=Egibacter rhizosphaerae TaxID=1670831 RepID=A0A411YH76_9ACTN|nr:cytochrome P450 [Egibacter rhizosphaerae]QBI20422.1 cytochrome P450 [Egibacter rhizosphaerae]
MARRSALGEPHPLRFDPLSPEQLENPYGIYEQLRDEAPVFYAEPFDLWVISRYEDVLAAARDHETFSSRHAVRSSMATPPPEVEAVLAEGYPQLGTLTDSDEPYHRRLRGLVNQAFTPKRVAMLEPRLDQLAEELIAGFASDGEAELIDRFAWPYPLAGIADMLGLNRADLEDLHLWSYHWLKLIQATDPVEDQVAYAESFVALQRLVMRELEARQEQPTEDLMSALLEARLEGERPLSLEEALWVPLNLIIAGHVTVTRAIGNSLLLLFQNPRLRETLEADLEQRMPAAVEEFLRLESPAQGLFRTTTRQVEVDGVTLPAGARVMLHYGSANRDPRRYEDPDEADLERAGVRKHLAFGTGIHVCIGAPLARLELRIALTKLLRRLPGPRLAGEPERDTIFFARGLSRLPVAWEPDG